MANKKVCIFSAQHLPHMGGVERYTLNLCKKLIEKGNEPVVVTSKIGDMPNFEIMHDTRVYRFNCYPFLKGRYPFLKKDSEYKKIISILEKENFDLVIVNTRFYRHSLVAMKFAQKNHIPCITIEHGTSHLSVNNKVLDFFGSIYEHGLTMLDKRHCDRYYGVSLACNEWLKHFHIEASGVLYNSIDVHEVDELRKNKCEDYRKKYNISKDATVITFTGRLLPEKGIPQLLNVMSEINKKRDDVYLFIAGEGDLEAYIDQRKNDHIIPLGRIDFNHIVALLDDSDIFCLPSFSEGFSTSVLEAAACECYIVTTARGGSKELVINKDYGTIIDNNSEELLLPALKEAINDKESRIQATKLSYQRLCENFTWDTVERKVELIIDEFNK